MTRYTVVWRKDADDDLAQAWMDAANREDVTSAADQVDIQLKNDPTSKGEELHEGLRRLKIPPLSVIFLVEEMDRQVAVVSIRLTN
jgi:hypothetical protein